MCMVLSRLDSYKPASFAASFAPSNPPSDRGLQTTQTGMESGEAVEA